MKHWFCWLVMVLLGSRAVAAEWQWSVAVPPLEGREFESPRAYLWVPPDCERVRGVVFAQHNMEEIGIMEHPVFREALAREGLAEVWIAPGMDLYFRFDQGAGEKFETMMRELAAESGYAEIADAPLVVIGHSAAASLPWIMAAWKPERVIAGISVSGWFPYAWNEQTMPHLGTRDFDTVPGLMTSGEYEDGEGRSMRGLGVRKEHPRMPYSYLGCPADGHFLATDEKIRFLSKYVTKAVARRLPSKEGDPLRVIDPTREGWVTAPYRNGRPPAFHTAAATTYQGKPEEAYWWFDEELARDAEAFQARHRGEAALVGFVQDGKLVEQNKDTHQQVDLRFVPADDGVTFQLRGAFLDAVPAGRPEGWTGKTAGEAIEVPDEGPPIEILRICGPVKAIDCGVWRLDFDRSSHLGDRRGNEAWLAALWPGNARWKQAVQQARLAIPRELKDGARQEITFQLPESVAGGTRELPLTAESNSGMKVRFYVREGPAEVVGDTLVFKPLPRRAKRPVKVTVVAWQFGRMSEPKVRSAEPSVRELWIQ